MEASLLEVDPLLTGTALIRWLLEPMVIFSDGDPGAPSASLMDGIVNARITISTVMIGGHVTPETMRAMGSRKSLACLGWLTNC